MPVETVDWPEPSRSSTIRIWVSLVLRTTSALRLIFSSFMGSVPRLYLVTLGRRQVLERDLRARPVVRDHFGRRKRAQLPALLQRPPPRQAEHESGCVLVAGAGGVHDFLHRLGLHAQALALAEDHRTGRAAGDRRELHLRT